VIFLSEYKLSIVIPAFNVEDKIMNAIESIQNQTIGFENIELIIVDDQSTDNTYDLIKEFSKSSENVSIYRTDSNSGYAGRPRNIGLEHATSDYVLFLDGDDKLLKNSCEVLYNKITSTDADIVIGGQINVYEGMHEHNPPLTCGVERIFTNMKNHELLDIRPAISAKLFKRELLEANNINFPEGIAGQDLVFLMESLLNSKKTIVLNNFYTYYRMISDNSVSFDISETYLKGLIKAYSLVCDIYDKFDVPLAIQEIVIRQHIRYFTSQVIRTNIPSNKTMLHELFNSQLFKNLEDKAVFRNSENYKRHFYNMSIGKYTYDDIDKIIDKINRYDFKYLKNLNERLSGENRELTEKCNRLTQENNKIKYELSKLESEIDEVKFKQVKIDDENIYLKKDNIKLYEKCDKLQNEIDELKS